MRAFLSLPDELLQSVIKYIAYLPIIPRDSNYVIGYSFTRPSTELLGLSVANWRLRQVCLSFLFANIRICDYDMEKLDSYIALLSRFTKTLVIELSPFGYETRSQIIAHILPQLERLRCVDLNPCRPGKFVLRTALALPTIISVLIHEFPDESFNNEDLSKVIFSCESLTISDLSLGFKRCLDHGVKLKHLRLYKPELPISDSRLSRDWKE
ncbi:hypothetical protein FB446DRAFT_114147 [Lentinula raphanica]|nr:hypothetical protein FB446DRAFT_114147 [Lentinula raphanica]